MAASLTTTPTSVCLQARPAHELVGAQFDCATCNERCTVAIWDEDSCWVECPCTVAVVERDLYLTYNPVF